jgi:hypothetical protein
MQIQASTSQPSPASVLDRARGRSAQVLHFAPGAESSTFASRSVGEIARVEPLRLDFPLIHPTRISLETRYAQQALTVYESVQQLEKREYLQSLLGVDDYA